MGLFRDRGDRPRLLGRGHERRSDRRDNRGDRRDHAVTGERTAKTAVRALGSCGDSPRTRSAMNKNISPSASAGPATDSVNPRRKRRPT
jgi:hypothetical protein